MKLRKMVENLVKRKECTSKRKIDALELLGAPIALSENAVEGFSYLKRGMEERSNEGVWKSRNPESGIRNLSRKRNRSRNLN